MSNMTQELTMFDMTSDGLDTPIASGLALYTKPLTRRPDFPAGIDQQRLSKIMIVDDEEINIRVARRYLEQAGYANFVTVTDSRMVLETVDEEMPDIVLLDVMMPHIDGLQVLHRLRNSEHTRHIPVIILTASTDAATKLEALDLEATEFLTKPVDRVELVLRVRNSLIVKAHNDYLASYSERLEDEVRARTAELEQSRREVIDCLARAADYRDGDTGDHVIRVGKYVRIIASQLGFQADYIDLMEQAAKLHDVGKIGIPDAILLKPGKLSPDEFDLMKQHCRFGADIIQQVAGDAENFQKHIAKPLEYLRMILARQGSPLLRLSALIALTHHEKWDGSGYPLGLKGEDIPIEGRIVAVADVFDAVSNARPYKPAFSLKKCLEIMVEGRRTHFDPVVLDAFLRRIKDVIEVHRRHS
jgi:putative two-component system response regulator